MPYEAEKGSKSIAVLILYLGARWGWVVNASPRPLYTRGGTSVSIVQEAGWVWTGVGKKKFVCFHRGSNSPVCSESLSRPCLLYSKLHSKFVIPL